MKNYFLPIYKIKIYKSISFLFSIIDETTFTKMFIIKPQQKKIKSINNAWFVNARAMPNNIRISVRYNLCICFNYC